MQHMNSLHASSNNVLLDQAFFEKTADKDKQYEKNSSRMLWEF